MRIRRGPLSMYRTTTVYTNVRLYKGPPHIRVGTQRYPRCRMGVQGGPLYTLLNFMFVITLPVGFFIPPTYQNLGIL